MALLRMMPLLLVLACCFGCAIKNEGAIDYRKTGTSASGKGRSKAAENAVFVKKYALNKDATNYFSKDDAISIYLNHGCVASFAELANPFQLETSKTTRGEIAIVAKVFEQSATMDLDFATKAPESGRLVYYNDDVRRGQPLNFSFLPIYGPRKYGGNPLIIQLYVLELDQDKTQYSGLLSALASIGAVAYPPASPILGLLDSLGTALLQRNSDDILFRYHFTLLPYSGNAGVNYPVLEAGNYVLVRKENRRSEAAWEGLSYDAETGRLTVPSLAATAGATQGAAPVAETAVAGCPDTYMVLTILKNSCTALDLDISQNTLSKFITSEFAETQDAKTLSALGTTVANYLSQRSHGARLDDLERQLRRLSGIDCATSASYCAPAYSKLVSTLDKEITDYNKGKKDSKKAVAGALTQAELESVIATLNAQGYFTTTVSLDGFNAKTLYAEINKKLAN